MTLEKILSRIYDLPSIPKVVQELIQNFNSPVTNAGQVSKNIQSDPVIAAKVLRLANSARYGSGRSVASLDNAIVLLGMDTLRTLVVASGVTGTFKSIPGLDTKDFWRNSFLVANISKLIARNAKGLDQEIAFTCGMLHNIGVALMHVALPEEMQAVADGVGSHNDRSVVERARFGFDNHVVAGQLAKAWKFPEEIIQALERQGNPKAGGTFTPYAAAIHLAVQIKNLINADTALDQLLTQLPTELTDALGLNRDTLHKHLMTMLEADDDIDSLLA